MVVETKTALTKEALLASGTLMTAVADIAGVPGQLHLKELNTRDKINLRRVALAARSEGEQLEQAEWFVWMAMRMITNPAGVRMFEPAADAFEQFTDLPERVITQIVTNCFPLILGTTADLEEAEKNSETPPSSDS